MKMVHKKTSPKSTPTGEEGRKVRALIGGDVASPSARGRVQPGPADPAGRLRLIPVRGPVEARKFNGVNLWVVVTKRGGSEITKRTVIRGRAEWLAQAINEKIERDSKP